MRRDKALEIVSLTRHQYYHQYYHQPTSTKRRGHLKSTHTKRKLEKVEIKVVNSEVIAQMLKIDADPDLSCGARRMTAQLQLMGYIINRQKVAALMKENGLAKPRRKQAKKTYAKYRIVTPTEPLMVIEMDIKQVWIVRDRRSAYILSILDTFTREVLAWTVGFSITSKEVKLLWDRVIIDHLEPAEMASKELRIEIRNDGGPQFAAKAVQEYFEENGLNQVFTHSYTRQENGHIESFHSILSSSIDKEYFDLIELENRLHRFYFMYNNERSHTGIKGLTPALFKRAWSNDLVITCFDEKKKIKMKLRHFVHQIPGILSQSEHLAKTKRAKRTDLKKDSGENKCSAINALTPVYPSSSVASCTANEVDNFVLIW
jgi:transposase InsO family protein